MATVKWLWVLVAAFAVNACGHNFTNNRSEPLKVVEVHYGLSNGSVSPDYSWYERYQVNAEGFSFIRGGGARFLNSGTWKISSFGKAEAALFEVLANPEVLKVKKTKQGHRVGGGSGYYEITYSDGQKVFVSRGSDSTFYRPELLTEPIEKYLSEAVSNIPEDVRRQEIAMPEDTSHMSVFRGFDSTEVDEKAREYLKKVAAYFLERNRGYSGGVVLEGHADQRGSREYNLELGQRAAEAVRDILLGYGVPASQVDAVSYGEEMPTCSESMDERCQAQNRRVDIIVR